MASATYAAKEVGRSKEIGWAGRLGLVAMGVSYGRRRPRDRARPRARRKGDDRQGALQTLAHDGLGQIVVFALAIGFGAYAIWRLAQAFLDRGGEGSGVKGLAKRIGYLGRALIYAGLCVTAVAILLGSRGSRSEQKETAWVLDWPAGRLIVAGIGAAFLGAALWNVVRGVTRRFKKQLNTGSMDDTEETIVGFVGVTGLLARGVVFGLIGVFFLRAAQQYDPKEAIGVDGALRKLAAQDNGDAILFIVATGLLAFGIFCLFQARYRRV